MYESGIFSFASHQPPPKMVQVYMCKEQEIKQEKDFDIDFRNSNIKRILEQTLDEGFDKIELLRKDKLAQSTKERCDAICFHTEGKFFENESKTKFKEILNEIKSYKLNFTENIAIEKMSDICDDLFARFKSSSRRSKNNTIYNSLADYLYVHKTYSNLIKKSKANIESLVEDFLSDLETIDQHDVYNNINEEDDAETNIKILIKNHTETMVSYIKSNSFSRFELN